MVHNKMCTLLLIAIAAAANLLNAAGVHAADNKVMELKEISIEAPKAKLEDTRVTGANPELTAKVAITKEEVESINAITMVDTLKYMPDTFIRQRFIGDANTPVGMGGTGYFQTADNMVFVDGFPLHFLLRSTFNGSPRFNLVSPQELSSTDITYGPFSALYPGNAMGGVINIQTHMPEKLEGGIIATGFFQNFKYLGESGTYGGYKTHATYGDKIGKFSIFAFYDHLTSYSQPMNSYFMATGPFARAASTTTAVTGPFRTSNLIGVDSIFYGDSGSTEVNDDLFKIKAQYEFSADLVGRAMFTVLDHKEALANPKSYLRGASGNTLYGGTFQYDSVAFAASNALFSKSDLQRIGINTGLGLKGNLPDNWKFDTVFSLYNEPRDLAAASSVNPNDSTYTGSGVITDVNRAEWQTFDLTLGNQSFLSNERLNFFTGYHFDHYRIGINQYNSNNWAAGTRDSFRASSGGETETQALLAQATWKFYPEWSASLGGRQEWWKTYNGFNNTATLTNNLQERDFSKFSPKFALDFGPAPWYFQLSLAQAYRFPIPGELYETITPTNTATITASSNLKPENGFAKGFMIRRDLDKGQITLNLFEKDIQDNIYSQTLVNSAGQTATTFLNINRTRARGAELFLNKKDLFLPRLDEFFSVSYLDTRILSNSNDSALEGKRLTLMPTWRLNALSTYHITDQWDGAVGVRYSSRPAFNLQNNDFVDVFGASTGYTLIDLKTLYHWKYAGYNLMATAGIDNVTDQTYFYFHPFPQRTYVFQFKATF